MYYYLNDNDKIRINVMKFLAIVLVVYIHAYIPGGYNGTNALLRCGLIVREFLSNGIGKSAVPLFFFISGFLVFRKNFKYTNLIRKKFVSLVIPYFFWNTFWIIIILIFQNVHFTSSYFSNPNNIILNWSIYDVMEAYGLTMGFSFPYVYPLWFLRELIIVTCFSGIMQFIINKCYKFSVFIIIVMIVIPVDWYLKTSVCYYYLGACFARRGRIQFERIDEIPILITGLLYIIIFFSVVFLDFCYLSGIMSLLGVLVIFQASRLGLFYNKIFHPVIESVFLIYVMHELSLTSVNKIAKTLLPSAISTELLVYFIIPILLISLITLLNMLLKKILPRLHFIITGSR